MNVVVKVSMQCVSVVSNCELKLKCVCFICFYSGVSVCFDVCLVHFGATVQEGNIIPRNGIL